MRQPHRKPLISVVATLLLLAGSAGYAWADSIVASESFEGPGLPLGWTLTGTGGVSGAVTGLAPTQGQQFAWIDNNGPVNAFAYGGTDASTLLSPLFTVNGNESVDVDLNFLSDDGGHYNDFAIAQLLSSGSPVATLYTATDPFCSGTVVSASGYPPLTPGVTLSPGEASFQGQDIGPIGGVISFAGIANPLGVCGTGVARGSTGWVTSSYTPPDGTYQLLFLVANSIDTAAYSALAIDNVRITTPEPQTLTLLLIGLAGLCVLQARRTSVRKFFERSAEKLA